MTDSPAPAPANANAHAGAGAVPLWTPTERPMHVVFFSSGGPGNVVAAFEAAAAEPRRSRIGLVVTDRPGIPALDVAERYGCPHVTLDFERERAAALGPGRVTRADPAYRAFAADFHTRLLARIRAAEDQLAWPFDFAVLAYRRIIEGPLLARFADRTINQHPADLTVRSPDGARRYRGIGGLARALAAGEPHTRTSTILVNAGVDTGEILCRGPLVPVTPASVADAAAHEELQKRASDWPSLKFALAGIAAGRFALARDRAHDDGSRVVLYDGVEQDYGGVALR